MESDWSTGKYFNSGEDFGHLATVLIGPAPSTIITAPVQNVSIDANMVNHLVAGFLYGMTTQNHLAEIETCWTGGVEIEQEILTSVHDFKAGGWNYITQGALNVVLAALQIPQELHACTSMQDDLKAIADWASVFTSEAALISTVTKHFLLHKKAVKADIA